MAGDVWHIVILTQHAARPIRNNRTGQLDDAITPDGIYKLVRAYSRPARFRDWRTCAAGDGSHERARP